MPPQEQGEPRGTISRVTRLRARPGRQEAFRPIFRAVMKMYETYQSFVGASLFVNQPANRAVVLSWWTDDTEQRIAGEEAIRFVESVHAADVDVLSVENFAVAENWPPHSSELPTEAAEADLWI